jgi:hypothetical protein
LDAPTHNPVGHKSHLLRAQQKATLHIKKITQSTIVRALGARKFPKRVPSMKILSFNARGVGGAWKKNPLKRLVQSLSPDVILIQETMVDGLRERSFFETWLNSWSFCTLDADGQSRGLLTSWSHSFNALSVSSLNSSIFVQLEEQIVRTLSSNC